MVSDFDAIHKAAILDNDNRGGLFTLDVSPGAAPVFVPTYLIYGLHLLMVVVSVMTGKIRVEEMIFEFLSGIFPKVSLIKNVFIRMELILVQISKISRIQFKLLKLTIIIS